MFGFSCSSVPSRGSAAPRPMLLIVLLVFTLLFSFAGKAFAISGTTLWCLPDGWEKEKSADNSVFAHLVYRENGEALATIDVSFRPLPEGHPVSQKESSKAWLEIFQRDVLSKLERFEFDKEYDGTFETTVMFFARRDFRFGKEKGLHADARRGIVFASTASGVGYAFVATCKEKNFPKMKDIFFDAIGDKFFPAEIVEHVEDYGMRCSFPEDAVRLFARERELRDIESAADKEVEALEVGEIKEELVSFVRDSYSRTFPRDEGYSSVGTALESFFSDWKWDVLNTGEDVVFSGVAAYDGKKAKFEFFLYTEGTFEEGFFVHAKKILVNGREIQIHFEDVLAQIYLK